MYYVYQATGEVIAVCSRLEDAEAMCQTVGEETKKYIVKKEVDKPQD